MTDYRLYTVGEDGHFNGYEPLVCTDDEKAIAKAEVISQRHAVELWSGARLVTSIPKQPAKTVTHEILEGCMVPKPAAS
jgi:hypothetical protein